MSVLSQFAAGGVKSIQRGTITGSSTGGTVTASISSVNPAKSFISSSCQSGGSSGLAITARVELISATQISISTINGTQLPPIVSWELIELH